MAKDLPFLTGRRGVLKFVLDNDEVVIPTTKFGFKTVGTEIKDDINGENRSRYDYQLDGYEANATVKVRDVKLLRAWLKNQDNDDAGVAPLDAALAFRFAPRDGSRSSFVGTEVTWDGFDWDGAENSATQSVSIKWRFRFMKEGKAA